MQGRLAKISLCRTSALGGRWYSCDDCGETTKLHNSCGDRHCPGCSGAKRADFNVRASALITPGVEHFQVIFTVPEIVSKIALANRMEITDLLFKSAWKALSKTIQSEQGYDPAALMVLHTWNQKLDAHWHVHALVPGAGPALSDRALGDRALGDRALGDTALQGEGIKVATSPCGDDSRKYLVDAIHLRHAYRKAFLRGLKSLYRRGKLSLGGGVEHLREQAAWDDLIAELEQTEWVSHIEPPPSEQSEADHVVGYMTRYLTGGPISDHRILAADDKEVTFLAREGRRTGGTRDQVPMTLSTDEFVRRWCLHIQPYQLTKTRCYGGWSNSKREAYLHQMRGKTWEEDSELEMLLEPSALILAEGPDLEGNLEDRDLCCDSCGSKSLRLSHQEPKPSWSELLGLDSECSPWWYAESQEREEKRRWDASMGEGFYDWYVAHVLRPSESARAQGAPSTNRRMHQPLLPGMGVHQENAGGYYAESF